MSSFKTKRIAPIRHESKKSSTIMEHRIDTSSEHIIPKKSLTKRLTGILLILSSLVFIGILGLQWIGAHNIGGNLIESDIFQSITLNHHEEAKKWVKNILIGGIGGKGHPGGELTDSLMLASLNFDEKTVTLLSIPRDLFVAHWPRSAGKINALYPIGQSQGEGVNLLAKKVSEITGQPIHHYVIIDFSGFRQIVDALGGVTVDVPNKIYDREYPNENWGYETFILEKGIQVLDGKTALKFARSRHSTSDFDRSSRQQLLLRAIKDKALSLGVITDPGKISDLVSSVQSHLSTDLTVGDLVNIGINFKDINNGNIVMYSYNNECLASGCLPGAYLYQPSMSLFGNSWVLIPEGATKSRLSKYDAMRRYAGLVFEYPHLKDEPKAITIVTNPKNLQRARGLRTGLEKLGFPIEHSSIIHQTGATLEKTRINTYWNEEAQVGFSEESILIRALKTIEPNIAFSFSRGNEFVTNQWPRIEIILGDDAKNYFDFSNPVEYLPQDSRLQESKTSTQASTQASKPTTEAPQPDATTPSTGSSPTPDTPSTPIHTDISESSTPVESYEISAGEWENF